MQRTFPLSASSRFFCQRYRYTIEMPEMRTIGAGDDLSIWRGCGCMAMKTNDQISFCILGAEIIRCFFPSRTASPVTLLEYSHDRVVRTYFALGGAISSYSPSAPVLTPSNRSRTASGRVKELGFFRSRLKRRGPKAPSPSSGCGGWRVD